MLVLTISSYSLADNLYSSKARFVFELLQNADDNQFTQAKAAGEAPYVSFQIHPRKIVVECNEDGFLEENLEAICSVGKSSKTGAQGYIGEKGIGFKSVFMAAWKVHIQSGDFSFYFKHEKEDRGLGMITPVWQDTDEEMPSPLTRMTLYLHETGNLTDPEDARVVLIKQFQDLQQTCLLFLKNLRQIQISFYNEDGALDHANEFTVKDHDKHRMTIDKKSSRGSKVQAHRQIYHVSRYTARNLPKSENRTYSEAEEDGKSYSTAEIILAFPLTNSSIPVTEFQSVFAFLPVRRCGFKVRGMLKSSTIFITPYSFSSNPTSSQKQVDRTL
jgi:hypothetical protein